MDAASVVRLRDASSARGRSAGRLADRRRGCVSRRGRRRTRRRPAFLVGDPGRDGRRIRDRLPDRVARRARADVVRPSGRRVEPRRPSRGGGAARRGHRRARLARLDGVRRGAGTVGRDDDHRRAVTSRRPRRRVVRARAGGRTGARADRAGAPSGRGAGRPWRPPLVAAPARRRRRGPRARRPAPRAGAFRR